jgi:hypothetical protein
LLAGSEHRQHWTSHVVSHDVTLCEIGKSNGLLADRTAALHVADWCYVEARRVGADVWILGNQYQPLA